MHNSMDRGLKRILWMSWTFRSRIFYSNYLVSNQVSQIISNNYWTINREINWSDKLEPLKKIMQESGTNWSKDFLDTLNIINAQNLKMDVKDTYNILSALVKITKDMPKTDVLYHEGFQSLCEQINKQIRFMSLTEVIENIKLLTFLKVSSTTVLMQNLLQIIRNSINDLQIDEIHIIISLLQKMEPTPLSSALKIALPVVLPTIVNTKLNYDDLRELSLALQHLRFEVQVDLITKICKSVQHIIKRKPKMCSLNHLKNIFISLSYMPFQKFKTNIIIDTMNLIEEVIVHKAYKLQITDITELIHAMSYNFSNGYMDHYNISFVNTLLEVAMSKKVKNKSYHIIKYLNNMKYSYKPFLDYLLNSILIENISCFDLGILLKAFSIIDYKPIPWDRIENNILDPEFINDNCNHLLLSYALSLIALNKYYPQLLSRVFTTFSLNSLKLIPNNIVVCTKLLYLYQIVQTLYTEYEGPLPSKEIVDYIYETVSLPKEYILLHHLTVTMGGSQYVLTNLRSKIGHIIDYAIIMRKGGYPIACNNADSKVEHVELLLCPPESYVILILELPRNAYSLNTHNLTNIRRLQLESLEKWTGHKCIDINVNVWKNLSIREQTPYLMQKIRDKCGDTLPDM